MIQSSSDPFDLNRFVSAQEGVYERVVSELKSGLKRSHWMWFIFPQIDGLGISPTARHFAIKSLAEAQAYLKHPVLGPRLDHCSDLVLSINGKSISDIFGYPDDLKMKSSMTLFACADEPESVYEMVLEKFFHAKRDDKTLQILEQLKDQSP